MATESVFRDEKMSIDQALGYPESYAKLCQDRSFSPFSHGPPFTFTPYSLKQQEDSRAKELDEMFPIIDPKAKPTTKPKIFQSLLWKNLNHLGNAGFDPETFRVDPYGNVLFYHADSASPLAWDIDHWFPCSRGGLTVPSNLRILQWQVCKRKHNKLEYLIPWWDFQLGISINQFMSIFASSNSDFRHRAFSWLFSEGESEELNASQTVDSHCFPQHFMESKEKLGLAPAAVVLSRRGSYDAPWKSNDLNKRPRSSTPIIAARKLKPLLKENEDPNMVSNPYQAIVMARDSLKQREETVKMQAEIRKLDNEVNELQQKSEEKVTIQDLELTLIKRRRRAEKCRRLAEAQSSYRAMLEKMIRDAMHQSVVYKEQVRLNQAAASALLARLEAQKAICDSAERELQRKYKQRDELEKQIRPEWEQARKRSRMDDTLEEEKDNRLALYSPDNKAKMQLQIEMNDSSAPLHKELWKFLEEEQKSLDASVLMIKEREEDDEEEVDKECSAISDKISKKKHEKGNKTMVVEEDGNPVEEMLEKLDRRQGGTVCNIQLPIYYEPDEEKDEESRKQQGKGNIEKWLQLLLENTLEDDVLNPKNVNENETDELIRKLDLMSAEKETMEQSDQEDDVLNPKIANDNETEELIRRLDLSSPEREILDSKAKEPQPKESKEQLDKIKRMEARKSLSNNEKEDRKMNAIANETNKNTPLKNPPYRLEPQRRSYTNESDSTGTGVGQPGSCEKNARTGKSGKGRDLSRSESARAFRRIPSSPSLILGSMKKKVDCMRKKPLVLDDNDVDDVHVARNSFIKSSIKTIKRAVKI
ncbi:titin homolog [Olea europaea var. sylvestris]|uniref:titin homolog n=1 Tax=Olea europaea var. sylvestris TaxID=158386 RepID=UPI000C1CDFF4|nr:titin homolog [Olea europaea var. sylvestris]